MNQGTFDHDKGQKSAISGRRLHCIFFEFSPVHFSLSLGFLCNLVRKPPKMWRKVPDFWAEKKSVESCHVSGCHGLIGPE